jgi:hypothetical protein
MVIEKRRDKIVRIFSVVFIVLVDYFKKKINESKLEKILTTNFLYIFN